MSRCDRMASPSTLRQGSPAPDSMGNAATVVAAGGDWQAGDSPPVPVISGASSESMDKVPGKIAPESVLDVALTLVLNEIAHQARSMTNATGSAVLLIRGGVPVYQSISGVTAGDASAYLSECSGRTDRFLQKDAPQRCNDVETDPRFDVASCRRLGIRSFLSFLVQDDRKSVVAMVQTFSARPEAFSDRDLLALQGLGRHIVDHIEAAERTFGSTPKISAKPNREVRPVKQAPSRSTQWSTTARLPILHERLNPALGVVIMVLAMLLGWTIGRSERESAHQNKAASAVALVNHSQIAVTPAKPASTSALQVRNQPTESAVPLTDAPEVNAKNEPSPPESERHRDHIKSRHSRLSKSIPSDGSSDELVIFESGNQVFPPKSARSELFTGAAPSNEKQRAESRTKDQKTPVSVSEDVAEKHLLNRIEPDYPESAREQRLQGTVILNVNVGKDGTVHSLSRVSGESQLALLAAKAVRQWKFAPLVRNGETVSFESQVTLSFVLP